MANHSSTKKSIRQIERRAKVNQRRKTRIKTFINNVNLAIKNNLSKDELLKIFVIAQSEIARGAAKRIFDKNTAARKIRLLAKRVKNASLMQ